MACFSEDCHWVKRHGDCFYDGVPPSNSPSSCKKCQFFKAPTNADRIRAMSDEELAYFIAEPSVAPPPWCKEIPVCPHMDEDIVPCHECALNWLQQEADT